MARHKNCVKKMNDGIIVNRQVKLQPSLIMKLRNNRFEVFMDPTTEKYELGKMQGVQRYFFNYSRIMSSSKQH